MVDIGAVSECGCVDVVVLLLVLYVVYVLFFKKTGKGAVEERDKCCTLPPMQKRDFTVEQLRHYNGVDNQRILIALLGKVFDVTKGSSFYGPEGPYSALAGHDATRALSLMDTSRVKDVPDDLNDLSSSDLDSAREWEQSFTYKYPIVGKLLKDGEEPTDYNGELASLCIIDYVRTAKTALSKASFRFDEFISISDGEVIVNRNTKSEVRMAFMYPMHFPRIPLRWDEPAWAVLSTDALEEFLLSRLESRISAQSEFAQLRCIPNAVCGSGLLQEIDDIEEDDEEVVDEDDEQNQ